MERGQQPTPPPINPRGLWMVHNQNLTFNNIENYCSKNFDLNIGILTVIELVNELEMCPVKLRVTA